jgi:transposase
VEASGLVQFGHSKDDPSRPQIKLMLASLDPMGMPLASQVVSGERADDIDLQKTNWKFRAGLHEQTSVSQNLIFEPSTWRIHP